MSPLRIAAAVISSVSLVLAACQPAQQASPTAPPLAATAAPKPTTAAAASPGASPANSPPASPGVSPAVSPAASPAVNPAASPAPSPAASPAASPVAAAAAAPDPGCPNDPSPGGKQLRVALVSQVGKIEDNGLNQSAWAGVQCAQKNLGFTDVKFVETQQSADYAANIDQFVQDGYDVIVTVGRLLGPATIGAAHANPNVKFIGVDQPQETTEPNLVGLVFDEDRSGYLAGYLAGLLTRSGTVGEVLGPASEPSFERYGVGFINGARAARPDVNVLTACATNTTDTVWGNDTANQLTGQDADLIFAAAGLSGNGALLAVADGGGPNLGIGVDTDQWLTLPDAQKYIVSSAMKLIVPATYHLIKAAQNGSFKGGNGAGDVGLAPFHNPGQVPPDVQSKVNQVSADLASGKTSTGFTTPTGDCPQA